MEGGQTVRSQSPIVVIGSGTWADIRLNGPNIADAHAVIVCSVNHCWIKDLGNEPAVRVNGQVERLALVDDQDLIEIGDSKLRIIQSGQAPPPRHAAPVTIDKERMRSWSPLARAVAVAYEPGFEADLPPSKPKSRALRVFLILFAVLCVLGVAAWFAWPYLRRYWYVIFKGA
jgi:hypothetical protein